jgi:deoxyhypusine synthase
MFAIEDHLKVRWRAACECDRSDTPAAFLLDVLRDPAVRARFTRPDESWLLAADEKKIPVWTPGWEDSTTGNAFTAAVVRGEVPHHGCVVTGTEQMQGLVRWYAEHCDPEPGIGFFQIGGGIAGDFAICTVPLLLKDLEAADTPPWGYFCQITDAVSSYGGYSGAPPNEKISWGKLTPATPRFMIQSDASIVAPLILAYVLGD